MGIDTERVRRHDSPGPDADEMVASVRRRSAASDRLRDELADLLALPSADGRYDLVWTHP